MTSHGRRLHDILNVVNRVGHPGIFSPGAVAVVNPPCFIHGDILQQSVASDRLKDVRLMLRTQIDCFRITAAFKIEDALFVPAMFIIPD